MTWKLLLVDHHKILRDGLKAILSQEPAYSVIGETESGREAVQICSAERPHIVILEMALPDMNGLDVAGDILQCSPETKIVILTMLEDEHALVQAIRAGVRAFLLKRASARDLLEALRSVANGGFYLSPQVAGRLLERMHSGNYDSRPSSWLLKSLTAREVQVLRLVAEGNTSKEIAQQLKLSLETVRSYRKNMMKKLRVGNVAGLTQVALHAGLTRGQALGSGARPATDDAPHLELM